MTSVVSGRSTKPRSELAAERAGASSIQGDVLPRLVLRIGLIGNREAAGSFGVGEPRIHKCVRELLGQVANAIVATHAQCKYYSNNRPLLRFVTGLASGADQVLTQNAFSSDAGAAVDRELFVVYPYEIGAYQKVNPAAGGLPTRSDWTLVLDPNAPEASCSQRWYEAQAWWIRQHSDLLVAIWDPANPFKRGGTEDSIQQALRQGLPVIWVQPAESPCVRILRQPEQIDGASCPIATKKDVENLVNQLLAFPVERGGRNTTKRMQEIAEEIEEFLKGEGSGSGFRTRLWQVGLRILDGMFFLQTLSGRGSERRNEWRQGRKASARANDAGEARLEPYASYKNKADKFAAFYAGQYRGGFMLNHLLGWTAVLCATLALFGYAFIGDAEKSVAGLAFGVIELIAIGWIILNVRSSKNERWHEKSINYRYLAELLRQMDFLAPLSCSTPSSRPAIQYAGHDPRHTWMNWLFRAVVREAAPTITASGVLRYKTLDAGYCEAVLEEARTTWIAGQIAHHRQNSLRMGRVYETIEFWSRCCFYFVVACGIAHLLYDIFFHSGKDHSPPVLVRCCLVFAIILPAAVITLIGFRNQAEARRLRERSESMALQLVRFSRDLLRMKNTRARGRLSMVPRSWEIAAGIHALGQVMIDEVTDWQIVYRMHEISEA
jgi:hypothetical protein